MLGIHQCLKHYDHRDKNLTHCSLQRTGMYVSTELTGEMQARYKKPVVWDEINYEGDIKPTFGNCTPQDWYVTFGRQPCAPASQGTEKHTQIRTTSSGGQKAADCTGKVLRGSAF